MVARLNKGDWWYLFAILFFLLCGVARSSYAAISCDGPSPAASTNTVPTGTYSIPRDAVVGTQLTPWTSYQGSANVWTNCAIQANIFYGVLSRGVLPSNGTVSVDGVSYTVYPTTVPGVGLIIGGRYSTASSWFPNPFSVGADWTNVVAGKNTAATSWNFGDSFRYAFVKTGPITSGTVTYGGQLAVHPL